MRTDCAARDSTFALYLVLPGPYTHLVFYRSDDSSMRSSAILRKGMRNKLGAAYQLKRRDLESSELSSSRNWAYSLLWVAGHNNRVLSG